MNNCQKINRHAVRSHYLKSYPAAAALIMPSGRPCIFIIAGTVLLSTHGEGGEVACCLPATGSVEGDETSRGSGSIRARVGAVGVTVRSGH